MAYLRTVFALIACKEASFFGVDLCSCTPGSTFYKLLEIERMGFVSLAELSLVMSAEGLLMVIVGGGEKPLTL